MTAKQLVFFSPPTTPQLADAMAANPIERTAPRFTIEQKECQCHLLWRIEGEQTSLVFYSDYRGQQLTQLWLWLLDISFGQSPAVLCLDEDLKDQCFWGAEYVNAQELQIWMWLQENRYGDELRGEYINPQASLTFQCSAHLFIQALSQALFSFFSDSEAFLWSFLHEYDEDDYRAMTLTEWPWGLFLKWHHERHQKNQQDVIKETLQVLSQATERSILFEMARDNVDKLAFEYAWTLVINDLLALVFAWDTAHFEQMCQPLEIFLDQTDAAWNDGQLYGNFDEAVYKPYTEPANREALTSQYRQLLSRWRQTQNEALTALKPGQAPTNLIEACFHWPKNLARGETKGGADA